MKLLVIRFSSIGDIVFTTPVLRCLKKQLPGAKIHFLTKEKFKAVTIHNPYIDKFFYYNNNLGELKKELKKENYDYIIDLHKNPRSYMIRMALRAKTFSYRKLSLQKLLLTKLHINVMPDRHIVLRSLDTVLPLGVKDDGEGLDYFIAAHDEIDISAISPVFQNGFIAIVIGGSYYTKKLPVEKLKELCVLLNQPIILVGGKEDEPEGQQIASIDSGRIFNACGKYTLNQSADVVRKARLVISHDTGLQYIACAFNKPVLAIWGGTSPKLAVEPYYGTKSQSRFTYKNFIVDGLKCQPCSNFGTKKCPKGHFKCMMLQDIMAIKQKADQIWDNSLS
jgi:ADP-heptose:LPS heptosyltransferase